MSSLKYCPKCHKEAYRITQEGETIKISQGSKTIFNVNDKSSLDLSLACPSGHPVPLKIKPKQEVELIKCGKR